MKTTTCILAIVIGSLLTMGGTACHKQSATTEKPTSLEAGLTALQASLMTASPQAQSNFFNGVSTGIRYGDIAKASAALQQIASDPSLNDQQKKLVAEVSDLLKQSQSNPPPPAH